RRGGTAAIRQAAQVTPVLVHDAEVVQQRSVFTPYGSRKSQPFPVRAPRDGRLDRPLRHDPGGFTIPINHVQPTERPLERYQRQDGDARRVGTVFNVVPVLPGKLEWSRTEGVGPFHLSGQRIVVDVYVTPPVVKKTAIRVIGCLLEGAAEVVHLTETEKHSFPVFEELREGGVAVLIGKVPQLGIAGGIQEPSVPDRAPVIVGKPVVQHGGS